VGQAFRGRGADRPGVLDGIGRTTRDLVVRALANMTSVLSVVREDIE